MRAQLLCLLMRILKSEEPSHQPVDKRQAALLTVFGGITVFLVKLAAYFLSNSVALLSDALESIVNIAASGLMLFSIYVAGKPADESHNYGHQKVENISSMLEGVLIVAAAMLIIYAAGLRLFDPVELFELDLAIGVSMAATAFNAGLSVLLSRTARTSGSAALEADAKHLMSDVISSAAVWVGLFVVQLTGWRSLDSLLAFGVAALIIYMGASLILKSSQHLMDQSCKAEEGKICEVLLRHQYRFVEFHDVKTRRQGTAVFAELHLCVLASLSVQEAHELTDHLEQELKDELPNVTLTIHVEPPQ
jgi:cation diffusion facilitator family transporter